MGRFVLVGHDGRETPLVMAERPSVSESGSILQTNVPLAGGGIFKALFRERDMEFSVHGTMSNARLALVFEWVPSLGALHQVTPNRLDYSFRDFPYSVFVGNGEASKTAGGAKIITAAPGVPLRLHLAQQS
jgi:hypothetical protein